MLIATMGMCWVVNIGVGVGVGVGNYTFLILGSRYGSMQHQPFLFESICLLSIGLNLLGGNRRSTSLSLSSLLSLSSR
jgi:hypothetical protein